MIEADTPPDFFGTEAVIEFHEQALADFGGLPGIRDRNALESAIAAPRQMYNYQDCDIADLGACYLWALAKNHAFTDGNKRTAYITCLAFLAGHGSPLGSPNTLEIATLAVAANLLDRPGLTGLIRALMMLQESDPEYYGAVHARNK